MRAYTLSVLTTLANSNSPIVEKEIVAWVNSKLEKAGKTSSLRNFQDSAIADAKIVIDLVDAIKPGCINYELLKTTSTAEVRFHFCHHFLKFFVVELIFFLRIIFLKLIANFVVPSLSGSFGQRQICHLDGPKDWCSCICSSGRYNRGETKNGDDSIRMFDGHGLHSKYGFSEK